MSCHTMWLSVLAAAYDKQVSTALCLSCLEPTGICLEGAHSANAFCAVRLWCWHVSVKLCCAAHLCAVLRTSGSIPSRYGLSQRSHHLILHRCQASLCPPAEFMDRHCVYAGIDCASCLVLQLKVAVALRLVCFLLAVQALSIVLVGVAGSGLMAPDQNTPYDQYFTGCGSTVQVCQPREFDES